MKSIIIWTLINLASNLIIVEIEAILFRKSVNRGWKEVGFSLDQIRNRHGLRPYYIMHIYYGGDVYPMVIKKKDYAELRKNKTGKAYVYVREYPAWFMNPNFNKYDFSLQEVDWHERDRINCLKAFLYIFIVFEAIICMIAFEVEKI
jgi:hypothetical protein|nr:hypothetical protein [uncultured Acetatifactor sp.]